MTTAYNVLEDKSDDSPSDVVLSGSWGDVTSTGEDNREIDVAGVGPLERNNVGTNGKESTDKEEENETVVELSLGELQSR